MYMTICLNFIMLFDIYDIILLDGWNSFWAYCLTQLHDGGWGDRSPVQAIVGISYCASSRLKHNIFDLIWWAKLLRTYLYQTVTCTLERCHRRSTTKAIYMYIALYIYSFYTHHDFYCTIWEQLAKIIHLSAASAIHLSAAPATNLSAAPATHLSAHMQMLKR